MEFCPNCRNMLYIIENEENLTKQCRNCQYSDTYDNEKAIKVLKTTYGDNKLLHDQYVNPYLPYDPTLQRINDEHIKCPNMECVKKNTESKVLFIKYNNKDMKFFYVCDYCGTNWKKND
jgi:DNA-directed RNA polymerase subunit M/transcription elongation factor TFIIS